MEKFLLITLPNCGPCHAMKEYLDRIELENGLKFEYAVIDASREDEIVNKYDIQSVPTLISSNGNKLIGNPGNSKLKEWIMSQIS